MKKVLLTGPTGFLGKEMAKRLSEKGIPFKAFVRKTSKTAFLNSLGPELVFGDITVPETLANALAGVDAVIHCAARVFGSDEKAFFRVNAQGTKNLVKAAERAGIKKFVHVSTADVVFRKGAYSLSKLEAEEAVKGSSLNWVILRPTTIFDAEKSKIAKLVLMVKRLPIVPVLGSGDKKLQPVWIGDVVDVVIKLLYSSKAVGKTYTIASEKAVSFSQLIDLAAKKLGKRVIKIHVPLPLLFATVSLSERLGKTSFLNRDQLALLSRDKTADISLAQKELGFRPTELKKALGFILSKAKP